MEHRNNLRTGIDGQPEPKDLFGTAQPGAEFVQLEVRELQVAERVLVQRLSVQACASEPRRDGGLSVAEDPFGRGRVQPFGQCRQDHGDLLRGSFQMIQGRVAPGSERGVAGRASKGLDPLSATMLAIANQRVNVSLDDAEIRALLIGTGETFSEYPLRGSPLAFDLAPGAYRSRCWSCTQRGSRGASTGRAIVGGAGLEQTVKPGVLGHAF
jgi:hypothetical protein